MGKGKFFIILNLKYQYMYIIYVLKFKIISDIYYLNLSNLEINF